MNPRPTSARSPRSAFTLVEIMVVVVVIGLLAAMALPAFSAVSERARATRFVNDMRVIANAAEQYVLERSAWPPDGSAELPVELGEYLPPQMRGKATTVLGGVWDWENGYHGITAAISVHQPTAKLSELLRVDRIIDDGDLSTGRFRDRVYDPGYFWILAP